MHIKETWARTNLQGSLRLPGLPGGEEAAGLAGAAHILHSHSSTKS